MNVTFRLDLPVYQALVNASAVTGVSMNSYVNQALASYLCMNNPYPTPKPIYRSNYEDTIRKLAGQ
jgi:hypothetical protein